MPRASSYTWMVMCPLPLLMAGALEAACPRGSSDQSAAGAEAEAEEAPVVELLGLWDDAVGLLPLVAPLRGELEEGEPPPPPPPPLLLPRVEGCAVEGRTRLRGAAAAATSAAAAPGGASASFAKPSARPANPDPEPTPPPPPKTALGAVASGRWVCGASLTIISDAADCADNPKLSGALPGCAAIGGGGRD